MAAPAASRRKPSPAGAGSRAAATERPRAPVALGPGRKDSPSRQSELVAAALHIIATQGVAALSTRSLAEQVGLTSGAIFRHFESIDALLDAVVQRVEEVLESTYPPAELPPRQRLERFVEARSTVVGANVGILRLVLSEQFLLALPQGGSARLGGCVRKTREFLARCAREGQADGSIRADVEPAALAMIVMGTIQILAVTAAHAPLRSTDATKVRSALGTLLEPPRSRTRR